MTRAERTGRTGRTWAIVGGAVLLAGILAIVISALAGGGDPDPGATSTPTSDGASSTGTPAPTTQPVPPDDVVDPTATDSGWTPEPITTDAETYVRSALAAASTFDTTLSSRDTWLTYLDTWFTPDTRYAESDQAARMKAAQLELRQGVVLPQETWESLASEDGRVVAAVVGDVSLQDVPEDVSGDMSIGTADVELTFTQTDGTGSESSYTENARVSVQVLCGPASVPTPQTSQAAGDCKVVRYFTEPTES